MSKFYAIRVGRYPGIYTDWAQAKLQVHKYSGADYKTFSTKEEAETWMTASDEVTPQNPIEQDSLSLPWEH